MGMNETEKEEYMRDQTAFDMDIVWFGIVPIAAFCVLTALMKAFLM